VIVNNRLQVVSIVIVLGGSANFQITMRSSGASLGKTVNSSPKPALWAWSMIEVDVSAEQLSKFFSGNEGREWKEKWSNHSYINLVSFVGHRDAQGCVKHTLGEQSKVDLGSGGWRVEDNLLEVSLLDGSEFEETLAWKDPSEAASARSFLSRVRKFGGVAEGEESGRTFEAQEGEARYWNQSDWQEMSNRDGKYNGTSFGVE
jgi:hypothetical protein